MSRKEKSPSKNAPTRETFLNRLRRLLSLKKPKIVIGGSSSFLMLPNGQWYACGANYCGELALGDTNHRDRWTPVKAPVGQSLEPLPSLFDKSVRAVQAYSASDKSFESMRTLVDSLSAEQLLLVPYHLRDEKGLQLRNVAVQGMANEAKQATRLHVLSFRGLTTESR